MGNEMVIVRNPADLELWQERFCECRRSGMTVAAWCEKQGISDKTYYYWHRKLGKLQNHTRDEESSTFYEISGNINNTAGERVVRVLIFASHGLLAKRSDLMQVLLMK